MVIGVEMRLMLSLVVSSWINEVLAFFEVWSDHNLVLGLTEAEKW